MLDVEAIRKDFPILDQIVNDEPLVYLDNAATTQKPFVCLSMQGLQRKFSLPEERQPV